MDSERDPIDAADSMLAYLEGHADVAHAEVGAVSRRQQRARVDTGGRGGKAHDPIETSGVWCRAFVDGAAGYRFTSALDDGTLVDVADRVIRSARTLAQTEPPTYDEATLHRASHGGWGNDRSFDAERALDRLKRAAERARKCSPERVRLSYQRDRSDLSVLTSTGSAVRTTLDRGSVTVSITPTDGPRLRTHVGTTTGSGVLDRVGPAVASQIGTIGRLNSHRKTDRPPCGRLDVLLGPQAGAYLFHHLSHYAEWDTACSGASAFSPGDRIAPEGLAVHDTIRPGSWAAIAYDTEGRPTHPVTVIEDGVFVSYLHSVGTAVAEGDEPAGNVVAPIGFEHPPRIHARHLTVDPGPDSLDALRADAAVEIHRVGEGRVANEATRAKRSTGTAPSALYAHNVRHHTPDRYDETKQSIRFDVREGYLLDGGERVASIGGVTLEVDLMDLHSLWGIGQRTETATGVCSKHRSSLPFAVSAPAIGLSATVLE